VDFNDKGLAGLINRFYYVCYFTNKKKIAFSHVLQDSQSRREEELVFLT